MKRSGTYWSWVLFGLVAQVLFVLANGVYFGVWPTIPNFFIQTFFSIVLFYGLRLVMDWQRFDNPVEDFVRELAISNRTVDQFAFACVGAFFLFAANAHVWPLVFKAWGFGLPIIVVLQQAFDVARITFVAKTPQGETEELSWQT